jgi:hypothetical protein
MFDRLSASMALARSSWQVLKLDKQLIVFPLLSGIGCLLVLASFVLPFALEPQWMDAAFHEDVHGNAQVSPWVWAVLFTYYFCNYFVIVFCNAALISCALMRFNGQEPTITGGLGAATARLPQILAWSLVSATVGVLLKLIENVNERVGEVVAMVLGTGWTIITYFVVPVLVVEKVGPFEAIKRSVSLLRQTWGTALVGGIRLGFFQFLLFIPGILLIVLGGYLSSSVEPQFLGFGVVIFGLVYLLFAAAISAALDTIFLSALYQYAAFDKVPAGFDRRTMEEAFTPKKAA